MPGALRARWQSGIQRIRLGVFWCALPTNGHLFFAELRAEAFPLGRRICRLARI